jgi:hypothetical protein
MEAIRGQPASGRFRPATGADLRKPPALVVEYRHATDIGLERHLVEQGLQYRNIAGSHAIFGRWRQLTGNGRGAGTQRLIEIVYFSTDELEQQQDANDGHRHHGQADDTPAYSKRN